MTTKELLNTYEAWICENEKHKRYIAVDYDAGYENAIKIANTVLKVKRDKLAYDFGCMNDGYVYRRGTVGRDVWLVWVA